MGWEGPQSLGKFRQREECDKRGLRVTFRWRGQKRVLESFVLVSGILLWHF